MKGCLASLRASEEALNCRTGELAACRSERDQLLALLAALKLRCTKPMKGLQFINQNSDKLDTIDASHACGRASSMYENAWNGVQCNGVPVTNGTVTRPCSASRASCAQPNPPAAPAAGPGPSLSAPASPPSEAPPAAAADPGPGSSSAALPPPPEAPLLTDFLPPGEQWPVQVTMQQVADISELHGLSTMARVFAPLLGGESLQQHVERHGLEACPGPHQEVWGGMGWRHARGGHTKRY